MKRYVPKEQVAGLVKLSEYYTLLTSANLLVFNTYGSLRNSSNVFRSVLSLASTVSFKNTKLKDDTAFPKVQLLCEENGFNHVH